MWRGCIHARRRHRHNRRIVAPVAIGPTDRRAVYLGDKVILFHARFGKITDRAVHCLDDTCRTAHIFDLGRAFDSALPVHQAGCILDFRIRIAL